MFEATLSSQVIRGSASYGTITGLALTPGAGTYLAIVTCCHGSAAAQYSYLALAVDGTEEADSEREHQHESSIYGAAIEVQMATHKVITVSAGEEIQARWKGSTASNLYCTTGALTLISVAPTDVDQNVDTANDGVNSATPIVLDNMTHTAPGAGDYLLVFSCSVRGGATADIVHAAVYVGGSELPHTERRYEVETSLTTGTSYIILIACEVSPTAGQDVEVRWWRTGSANATCHERISTLIANRTQLEVSGTATDSETGQTDVAIDDLTHVNPPAGDYLAIGSWINFYGSITVNNITTPSLYEETTQVTNSERRYVIGDSLDNMDMPMFTHQKVSPNGSEDVSLQWRGSSSDQRSAYERTFVLLLDALSASREQEGYRFRDDDANEASATWLDSQDTDVTVGTSDNFRLRTLVDTVDADPPSEGLQLEYKKVGDAAAEWRKVPLT